MLEQIAFKCGYDDIGFFRKIFKRHVAINPKEYQKKYGKTGSANRNGKRKKTG